MVEMDEEEDEFQHLRTIKDFDFGTSDVLLDFLRSGKVPFGIPEAEVNLLLWLVLESKITEVEEKALEESSKEHRLICGSGSTSFSIEDINDNDSQQDEGQAMVRIDEESSSMDLDVVDHRGSSVGENRQNHQLQVESAERGYPRTRQSPLRLSDPFIEFTCRTRRRTISQSTKIRKQVEELLRMTGISTPFNRLSVTDRKAIYQHFVESSVLLPKGDFESVSDVVQELQKTSRFRDEYKETDQLGDGSYGTVHEVVHKGTGQKYAVKKIKLKVDDFQEMKMALNESKIQKRLSHENIVRCFDAWVEMDSNRRHRDPPFKFHLLLERCYISLEYWLQVERVVPSWNHIITIMKSLTEGLKYLHSCQIMHFDINTKNVLWADGSMSSVKIADFGLAIKGEYYAYQTGTVPYAAPDGIFTHKSDMYSFGVTLLEVGACVLTTSELMQHLKNSKVIVTPFPFLNQTLPKLLSENPNSRPNIFEFEKMAWLITHPDEKTRGCNSQSLHEYLESVPDIEGEKSTMDP